MNLKNESLHCSTFCLSQMNKRLALLSSPAVCFTLSYLRPSSFCSTPNPKILKSFHDRTPKYTGSARPSTRGGDHRIILSANPSTSTPAHSTASSIVSVLSESSDDPPDFDSLLKKFKDKLTSDIVLRILGDYKKLGRSKTLHFFSWAGFHLDFRFDDAVVEYMADFLGRRKLFDDLKSLLKTVASRRGTVSTRSVAISVRFLGRHGRITEAMALFERMEFELGCRPDNLVFDNVLYVLCRKDPNGSLIDAALLIFRRIGKPDEFAYSNIVIGLCMYGRMENAIRVFNEMGEAHLVPTRSAANILIKHLCEYDREDEVVEKVNVTSVCRPFEILVPNVGAKCFIDSAVDVFWAIFKLEIVPSGHVITALIAGLCKFQKFEDAVEILKKVGSRKLRCVEESYTISIREMCKVCRKDEACSLFEGMLHQGLRPKVAVYNSLIQMHCKLNEVDEAKKKFDVMKRRRCEPDCATYIMLIHSYSLAQNWEVAYTLLMEMINVGWHPHLELYMFVDSLLTKNGRHDLSLKLGRKMDAQLLHSHCKAGRVDAAYEKLNSMFSKGLYPPIYVKDAFERAFKKAGKWKVASQILNDMDKVAFQKNEQPL